ncbi:MAG: heme NO-binding domain-containing protein [Candidatus Sericytochromatia bacterium]
MHGIIFNELKNYADLKYGTPAWSDLIKEAGLFTRVYLPIKDYPDEEIVNLIVTASKLLGKSVDFLLEDFGEFVSHKFIESYKQLLKPEWKVLDFIQNAEEQVHVIIRKLVRGSRPPVLKYKRVSKDELVVYYASERKLCVLAKGVIRGAGNHYNEKLFIWEKSCMHKGAECCEITIMKK